MERIDLMGMINRVARWVIPTIGSPHIKDKENQTIILEMTPLLTLVTCMDDQKGFVPGDDKRVTP